MHLDFFHLDSHKLSLYLKIPNFLTGWDVEHYIFQPRHKARGKIISSNCCLKKHKCIWDSDGCSCHVEIRPYLLLLFLTLFFFFFKGHESVTVKPPENSLQYQYQWNIYVMYSNISCSSFNPFPIFVIWSFKVLWFYSKWLCMLKHCWFFFFLRYSYNEFSSTTIYPDHFSSYPFCVFLQLIATI